MDTLKFLAVVLICGVPFFYKEASRDLNILKCAMIATIAADYNMLVANNIFLGICIFCVVQFIYCYRFTGIGTAKFLLAAYPVWHIFRLFTEPLISVALVYIICFIFSLSSAFYSFAAKKYTYPKNYLNLWGMVLFALCDINVALGYFGMSNYVLVWIFYLPAQILLALSGYSRAASFNDAV